MFLGTVRPRGPSGPGRPLV